jgi:hypothetical protein
MAVPFSDESITTEGAQNSLSGTRKLTVQSGCVLASEATQAAGHSQTSTAGDISNIGAAFDKPLISPDIPMPPHRPALDDEWPIHFVSSKIMTVMLILNRL